MKRYNHTIKVLMIVFMALSGITVSASEKVMIEGVPIINQYPELPTGCEATALTMLLQYYGIDTTKEDVARAMPKAPLPTYKNGQKYGEHPDNAFIGDPFSRNSYGVYSPVIFNMINDYLPGQAEDLGGGDFNKVYQAIDEGRPVIIWTTIGMENVEHGTSWITPDGNNFNWLIPEHAVVMVGYDEKNIYMNDPYTGRERSYPKQMVINRWVSMGRQAVAIKGLPQQAQSKEVLEVYPYVKAQSMEDLNINGTVYKDALRVDAHGEWLRATYLKDIHEQTTVSYNPKTQSVEIVVRENERMPSDTSTWNDINNANIRTANAMNINGRYYTKIELIPSDKDIITYNSKGEASIMNYKIVDGKTYVSTEWANQFYNLSFTR